jgi:phosphopantothenoylcysteine decarboxylase/phosphopantothenate--cysteine ligase
MNLKGKRILITAGPTWVPIDEVRVISNVATGATGILLAREALRMGAQVTLLLGPAASTIVDKRIRIIRFTYFDELRRELVRELSTKKYDAIIHAAAVADYRPKCAYKAKIRSDLSNLNLTLIATPKLVDMIKRYDNSLLAVAFKFEPDARSNILMRRSRALFERSGVNLVVANTVRKGKYRAYIMGEGHPLGPLLTKHGMVHALLKKVGDYFVQG